MDFFVIGQIKPHFTFIHGKALPQRRFTNWHSIEHFRILDVLCWLSKLISAGRRESEASVHHYYLAIYKTGEVTTIRQTTAVTISSIDTKKKLTMAPWVNKKILPRRLLSDWATCWISFCTTATICSGVETKLEMKWGIAFVENWKMQRTRWRHRPVFNILCRALLSR